jgi:type 1 glutamine amidotransferase
MHRLRHLLLALCLSTLAPFLSADQESEFNVLVFSKTAGFRHGSIEVGTEAIRKLGEEHGFKVEASEEAEQFSAENLDRFQAVIFLNTTRTVFEESQREAFRDFIRAGGGYVGVHAAADTEYDWEWYGQLVGAYFKNHPRIQEAVIHVEDRRHPSTSHLPEHWKRTDEWYNFRASPRDQVQVVLSLDTGSFEGSAMEEDHPIAWFHHFDGGRAFYTGLGHTNESYAEEAFLQHLLGAIRWAAGQVGDAEKGD